MENQWYFDCCLAILNIYIGLFVYIFKYFRHLQNILYILDILDIKSKNS